MDEVREREKAKAVIAIVLLIAAVIVAIAATLNSEELKDPRNHGGLGTPVQFTVES